MDRRQLLFGATTLGLITNVNLNHPLIAHVGVAVMGSRRLSDRERAGLRGPLKTCSDPYIDRYSEVIGAGIIFTDYSPDGKLLGHRARGRVRSGGFKWGCFRPDETYEFYDKQGRKTRLRTVSQSVTQRALMLESRMFEVAVELSRNGHGIVTTHYTVTTTYNENDQPIESLIRNANGELLTKISHNYNNGLLISETLVVERLSETEVNFRKELQRKIQEEQLTENEREEMATAVAFQDQLQRLGVECSYTYDADDCVIRTLLQVGDFKGEERRTYNEQGDENWTLRVGFGDEPKEVRYLYQYDSHGFRDHQGVCERTAATYSRPGSGL
jgi:hypothetical protein